MNRMSWDIFSLEAREDRWLEGVERSDLFKAISIASAWALASSSSSTPCLRGCFGPGPGSVGPLPSGTGAAESLEMQHDLKLIILHLRLLVM